MILLLHRTYIQVIFGMMEKHWIHILGIYIITILWMLLNVPTFNKIHIVSLNNSWEPGEKVQDDEKKP